MESMSRVRESWSWTVILILLVLTLPASGQRARAGDRPGDSGAAALDAPSTEALVKTQALLTTPALRDAAVQKSQGAQLVDGQAKALGGSQANVDSIYGLSSSIFEDLVKETQGDPVKMQELLERAKNDPKAFAEHLSEKNKAALRGVANKISDAPTTATAPAAFATQPGALGAPAAR